MSNSKKRGRGEMEKSLKTVGLQEESTEAMDYEEASTSDNEMEVCFSIVSFDPNC